MYTGARGTCFAQGQRTRVAQSGPSFARQKEYKTFQMKLLVLVAGQPEPDPQKKKKSSSSIHISALYFIIVRPLLLISVQYHAVWMLHLIASVYQVVLLKIKERGFYQLSRIYGPIVVKFKQLLYKCAFFTHTVYTRSSSYTCGSRCPVFKARPKFSQIQRGGERRGGANWIYIIQLCSFSLPYILLMVCQRGSVCVRI